MQNISQKKRVEFARKLHSQVTKDWYDYSIKTNILQRFWHNYRFREVSKEIKNLKGLFLDVGCCDGTFTQILLKNSEAKKIYGIDVLIDPINYAKKKFKRNKKLTFSAAEAHMLPFKNKFFDAVFCLEAMEHIKDSHLVLKEMSRVLKKNGYIILLVPSENLLFKMIWFIWKRWRGRIWEGTHINEFDNNKLVELVSKSGFTIEVSRRFLLNMLHVIKARLI